MQWFSIDVNRLYSLTSSNRIRLEKPCARNWFKPISFRNYCWRLDTLTFYTLILEKVENSALNKSKAMGPNSIPSNTLLLLKSDISVHLSKILNLSLLTGVYSDKLEITKIIPLFNVIII